MPEEVSTRSARRARTATRGPPGSWSWRIGGLAGEGIDTAGDVFAKAALHAGWHVWTTRHFPSRIRGGLTTYTTRIATGVVTAPAGDCDMIVALHDEAADAKAQGLKDGGLVLFDAEKVDPVDAGGHTTLGVDFTGIAKTIGEPRVRNMVALGASARLVGMPLKVLQGVVAARFDAKAEEHRRRAQLVNAGGDTGDGNRSQGGPDGHDGQGRPDGQAGDQKQAAVRGPGTPRLVAVNQQALERGWEAAAEHGPLRVPPRVLEPGSGRLFLSGNEAFAFGAAVAGCRFYAGYPITPATTIMEYLAANLPSLGGVCLQVEDELAAASMAIGAGFAGTRAMTASSGPGVSLMAESVGLAVSTETPVVIVDCMRPGPSTGMPTKTAQEDLSFLLAPGHSEGAHIVLAAEDLAAAYRTAVDAFNLAERYQCPVFVALDAALCVGKGDTGTFPLDVEIDRGRRFTAGAETAGAGEPGTGKGYERYAAQDGGPPLRAVPGDVGGRHYANSTEHSPAGYTTEDPVVRAAMVRRRRDKLAGIDEVHAGTRLEGDPAAALGVVAYGSVVGVVREALKAAAARGVPAALLILRRLHPLPVGEVEEFMEGRDTVLVVEQNATAQLLRHLRSLVPEAHHAESVRKFTGEPFVVEEIVDRLLATKEGGT